MKVYLVRHGTAVNIGEQGVTTDAARMLSDEGRAKTGKAARGLSRVPDVTIERIVSSPLVRALETAEIFAKALGVKRMVESLPELAPGRSTEDVTAWLAAQPPADIAPRLGVDLHGQRHRRCLQESRRPVPRIRPARDARLRPLRLAPAAGCATPPRRDVRRINNGRNT